MPTWLTLPIFLTTKTALLAGWVFLTLVTAHVHQRLTPPVQMMVVASGSMSPSLRVGDLVVIKPALSYNVGDVITYHTSGAVSSIVTHRIKAKQQQENKTAYQTQGDANNIPDQLFITSSQVIGKQVARLPLLGWPLLWVQTPIGVVGLVVIPAVIIAYEELKQLKLSITKWPRFNLGRK